MHHTDPKKYPKKPELLWDRNAGDQTVDEMIAIAKMLGGALPREDAPRYEPI